MVSLLSDIGMYHRETDGENQDVVSQKENKGIRSFHWQTVFPRVVEPKPVRQSQVLQ